MWQKALIGPDETIRSTLSVIDHEALRAAFVVDSDRRLLGMVTDGDIRRGLLRGLGLDAPVRDVMNPSPRTFSPAEADPDRIRATLRDHRLLLMPIVADGILVNVLTLDELQKTPRRDNPVFLMAGGFGTRLRPLTDTCPKPMLEVGGKPILERILDHCREHGFHRFYISTHYMAEQIHAHFGDGSSRGVSIRYVHEAEPLGTGGAVGLLPDDIGDLPLVVMNGDLLTRLNLSRLLDFHNDRGLVATMCVREYEHQVPFGVITIDGTVITEMVEKPVSRYFINAGIYVLERSLVSRVPVGARIDMPSVLQAEIDRGGRVSTFPIHEYWRDIGRMDDFEMAQREVALFF
jgi:dTDP-glucose pyrophosphorylase